MVSHSFNTNLGNLVKGRKIVIPEIQRAYSWSTGDTSKEDASDVAASALIEDLEEFHKSVVSGAEYGYYLGSLIVLVEKGEDVKSKKATWNLLDGQQRITTLTILLNEIFKRLQLYDESQEINDSMKAIKRNWMSLGRGVEPPEKNWKCTIYPRRDQDRDALRAIISQKGIDDLPEGNMKETAKHYNGKFSSYETSEINAFVRTLLDRVIFSVIVTDESTMAYQMFQTANARGTPLTTLDLFRSTVIKRAETELELNSESIGKIMKKLDLIERLIAISSGEIGSDPSNKQKRKKIESKKEKITKSLMDTWVGCRDGEIKSRGLLPYITSQLYNCQDGVELGSLVSDLLEHATTWHQDIELSADQIPIDHPLHPVFNIASDQWRYLALGVHNLENHPGPVSPISEDQMNAIFELQTWWSLLEFAQTGKANTTSFRDWAREANMCWQQTKHAPSGGVKIWNKETFRERCDARLGNQDFTPVSAFGTVVTYSDGYDNAKRARAILAMYEKHVPNGFGPTKHGSGTKDVRIAPLFSSRQVGWQAYMSIGNWFLIRGVERNGLTVNKTKEMERKSQAEQITLIRQYASHASKRDIPDYHLGSPSHQNFIQQRTTEIVQVLNAALRKFILDGYPS